jgi:hydrogenase maturation protein HypF
MSAATVSAITSIPVEARRIRITGVVQGVGFRPYVYTLARGHAIGGWARNTSSGVEIVAVGSAEALDGFAAELPIGAPPLALIDGLTVELVSLPGSPTPSLISSLASPLFTIQHSQPQAGAFVPVAADVAVCADCLRELFDPGDRRYRYPFINCTNCGPRFTIVRDVPYDRPLTTMQPFAMCPACRAEYTDPAHRRFHAQPNACPDCGPVLSLYPSTQGAEVYRSVSAVMGDAALLAARRLLRTGAILAVKGLGGYHLACDARSDAALARLRSRKGRVDKPFAVMARDLATAAGLVELSDAERLLLAGRERPIVLLPKAVGTPVSAFVAPGSANLGVMLPYTPLHHLLLAPPAPGEDPNQDLSALVMTSGNLSEEPIVFDDAEAQSRLASLADAFLTHNRAIHVPCDDSVVRIVRDRLLPLRRGRGYAPLPIRLPFAVRPLLAVGAELKNTFCIAQDRHAFLSQHIGDMENLETLRAFERTVEHFQKLFRVAPELLVCDLHPGYLSTRWAQEQADATGLPLIHVQHHHAHMASVMAEHGLPADARVIGVSFDGTGYGPDGTIWGGEFLVAGYADFTRVGRLKPVPLPGGDAAIRRPYRVALAHLWASGLAWEPGLPPVAACPAAEQQILQRQLAQRLNTVPTSSMGRLFDAVAALAGVRQTVTYEAQAALELEALARAGDAPAYGFDLVEPSVALQSSHSDLQFEVDAGPVLAAIVKDVLSGASAAEVAGRFHQAVADVVVAACAQVRGRYGLTTVALSGGVFQNVRLLAFTLDRLEAGGFTVLIHRQVPPNDGGLALGQAMIGHCAAAATAGLAAI